MLDHLAAIAIGVLVFMVFMLVFMKRDAGGRRGTRLAGCQHHHPQQGCERCRGNGAGGIRSQMPDRTKE